MSLGLETQLASYSYFVNEGFYLLSGIRFKLEPTSE